MSAKKKEAKSLVPSEQSVVNVPTSKVAPFQVNPETLIMQAIQQGVPVETMERLLAMRRELRAEWAKEQYDLAMAKFQAECPIIEKKKAVKDNEGVLLYKYAPLDSIVSQAKEAIKNNNFSYAIKSETKEKGVISSCVVRHSAGHSEEYPFEVPYGNKTRAMNNSQVTAAALTFAKRYAFCNAFGILTGDEDTDGRVTEPKEKPKTTPVKELEYRAIKKIQESTDIEEIEKIETYVQAGKFSKEFKQKILDLRNDRVIALGLAPTIHEQTQKFADGVSGDDATGE